MKSPRLWRKAYSLTSSRKCLDRYVCVEEVRECVCVEEGRECVCVEEGRERVCGREKEKSWRTVGEGGGGDGVCDCVEGKRKGRSEGEQ